MVKSLRGLPRLKICPATPGAVRAALDRRHELADVEEGSPLPSAVDQLQRRPGHERVHEASEHAGDPLAVDARDEVHAGADDVERTDDREGETAVLAMRPDHALEQLLGGRVGPPLALHRSEEERGLVLHHLAHRAAARVERRPPVHLAGQKCTSQRERAAHSLTTGSRSLKLASITSSGRVL